jgi:hypothetical protein
MDDLASARTSPVFRAERAHKVHLQFDCRVALAGFEHRVDPPVTIEMQATSFPPRATRSTRAVLSTLI